MPQDNTTDLASQFLPYIQQRGLTLRGDDVLPKTLQDWEVRKKEIRENLMQAWGRFPQEPCALEPRTLGELKRDGYRVEKIVFQTRPGIVMTANAYVPDGGGKRPAVLCVHGHWSKAKQEPVVQARCIGLAKLGFFVLVVDAFGAGERGIGKPLGEYHGEMVAATLWPVGLALAGLQVYENMRAVDYLLTRPEVDGKSLGITGASGGGNQTMYAGAFDERFGCVVPTCSVGTYQSYLGAACCMCELVPNAMTYTEEWGILALTAPRALMLTNATRDSFQFSPGEAKKSFAKARRIFELYGKSAHAKHTIIESKHDYNQQMREAMYGWMTLHLKGEGTGEPIPEPEIKTEDPESLRCYPGETRPDTFVTLPQFAAGEARKILKTRTPPVHKEHWESEEMTMRFALENSVLGQFPRRASLSVDVQAAEDGKSRTLVFYPEPGITVTAHQEYGNGKPRQLAILLDLSGREKAADTDLAKQLRRTGSDIVTVDLRATGSTAYSRDTIRRAPDHNTAEWSMWTGRPLLGQWVWDVSRLLDVLEKTNTGKQKSESLFKRSTLIGIGPAGVVALCAAVLDARIEQVATVGTLASFVSDVPYENQRLGIMAPRILSEAGDIPHLAALLAPRRLVIAGGVTGGGKPLNRQALTSQYNYTRKVYSLEKANRKLTILESIAPEELVQRLMT
ncbi:MAG: acetylxylan esterase [Planctomycetes bacterium]|nr:acetylxylan esterase [Planctomycetota bacterium]